MKHRNAVARNQRVKRAKPRSESGNISYVSDAYVDEVYSSFQSALKAKSKSSSRVSAQVLDQVFDTDSKVVVGLVQEALQTVIVKVREDTQHSFGGIRVVKGASKPLTRLAENMQQSIEALGSAMADLPEPVSPQLARSVAATERAWRDLEEEFGLLTSIEVSTLLGSDPPNRTYASHQRSKGKLIAVKRPKGLLYPGFQFSATEPHILPVMEELKTAAAEAGRSEASLALWMTRATRYLNGDRPVDRLSEPEKVAQAAKHSFGVQW